MDNVIDVIVGSEKNPIIANIGCTKVNLSNNGDDKKFMIRQKEHRRKKYRVHIEVNIVDENRDNNRFKKY
ncbi:MAG: hypothetical protein KAV87_50005 [Desulfobacteraceae bacterium]|nr:hypothetical protein [Desulfobacteraceae bacterium]